MALKAVIESRHSWLRLGYVDPTLAPVDQGLDSGGELSSAFGERVSGLNRLGRNDFAGQNLSFFELLQPLS